MRHPFLNTINNSVKNSRCIKNRYICQNISSMTTYNETKLMTLLNSIKPGTIVLASWLEKIGISRNLQKHYIKSGWLESVGRGAFKRPGDHIQWQGGLYSIQHQSNVNVHAGALTALALRGLNHYFRLEEENIFLFTSRKIGLPKWFLNHNWENQIRQNQTTFLPTSLGIEEHEEKNFSIQISSPERAMLECLYLAPDTLDLVECFHLMEGLVNLRPQLVQQLLQQCNSIKVKRLFLYLSEKTNHSWLQFVDPHLIDIGNGNRSLSKGGTYVSKYQITIPNELAVL